MLPAKSRLSIRYAVESSLKGLSGGESLAISLGKASACFVRLEPGQHSLCRRDSCILTKL